MAMGTYPGDPHARPDLMVCAITATGTMMHKREALIGKMVVCWLNGNIHDTGTHHVADSLEEQLHINCHKNKVVKHFPE